MGVYVNTADSQKTNEAIITPTAGKKIHLMFATVRNPSGNTNNAKITIGGSDHVDFPPGMEGAKSGCVTGATDESVLRSCDANTEYDIHYEEID